MGTIRIEEPALDSTKELVQQVLIITSQGNHALFLTDPGSGNNVVARIRVMISRKREEAKRRRIRMRYFKIHHSVMRWTELDGTRKDCIIMWESRNDRHLVAELIEDLGVKG